MKINHYRTLTASEIAEYAKADSPRDFDRWNTHRRITYMAYDRAQCQSDYIDMLATTLDKEGFSFRRTSPSELWLSQPARGVWTLHAESPRRSEASLETLGSLTEPYGVSSCEREVQQEVPTMRLIGKLQFESLNNIDPNPYIAVLHKAGYEKVSVTSTSRQLEEEAYEEMLEEMKKERGVEGSAGSYGSGNSSSYSRSYGRPGLNVAATAVFGAAGFLFGTGRRPRRR